MDKKKTDESTFDPSRRRILAGMAAAGAAAGLTSCSSSSSDSGSGTAAGNQGLPNPQASGIDYIVVVMMENRSFDHILGWLPGADGQQAGLSYLDTNGATQTTFPMIGSSYGWQGCGFSDPDHSYDAGHADYGTNGAMDGFLKNQPVGDPFPLGYYVRDDVPFFSACADNWTICDHYFTGILAPTFPNRIYMHSGQTDRIKNSYNTVKLPTIWDSLIAAKVPCKYYYADTPNLSLWGSKYDSISFKLKQFVTDFSAGGTPPQVSYVDPYMGGLIGFGELFGTSWDDHAYADIRNGQSFMNYIYNVLRSSPVWDRTLLIINYDEWGGFFDHVPPPVGPVSDAEQKAGNADGRLGIRVPCILIGPRARRGHVETAQYDPNAILNMIGWRFGFTAPGIRASTSGNIANALDFTKPADTSAPTFDVSYNGETGPFPIKAPYTVPNKLLAKAFGGMCSFASLPNAAQAEAMRRLEQHYAEVRTLQALGKQNGFDMSED